jgi:hypothetical protein
MNVRTWLLNAAHETVSNDRVTNYGTPEQTFQRIAAYWTVFFGIKIQPWQVAAAMILLKMARLQNNPAHVDSLVDGCGYFACWADVVGVEVPVGD